MRPCRLVVSHSEPGDEQSNHQGDNQGAGSAQSDSPDRRTNDALLQASLPASSLVSCKGPNVCFGSKADVPCRSVLQFAERRMPRLELATSAKIEIGGRFGTLLTELPALAVIFVLERLTRDAVLQLGS